MGTAWCGLRAYPGGARETLAIRPIPVAAFAGVGVGFIAGVGAVVVIGGAALIGVAALTADSVVTVLRPPAPRPAREPPSSVVPASAPVVPFVPGTAPADEQVVRPPSETTVDVVAFAAPIVDAPTADTPIVERPVDPAAVAP